MWLLSTTSRPKFSVRNRPKPTDRSSVFSLPTSTSTAAMVSYRVARQKKSKLFPPFKTEIRFFEVKCTVNVMKHCNIVYVMSLKVYINCVCLLLYIFPLSPNFCWTSLRLALELLVLMCHSNGGIGYEISLPMIDVYEV